MYFEPLHIHYLPLRNEVGGNHSNASHRNDLAPEDKLVRFGQGQHPGHVALQKGIKRKKKREMVPVTRCPRQECVERDEEEEEGNEAVSCLWPLSCQP